MEGAREGEKKGGRSKRGERENEEQERERERVERARRRKRMFSPQNKFAKHFSPIVHLWENTTLFPHEQFEQSSLTFFVMDPSYQNPLSLGQSKL